jgi:hypothetical protein
VKRDRELLHRLLVKLEEWPGQPADQFLFSGHEQELAIDGYSGEQIEYHLGILKAEGYIDSTGSQPMQSLTFRSLTPAGHDMVDQYRETLDLYAAKKAAEESRNWIPAAEAAALLKSAFNSQQLAEATICKRAHGGLIRARAERFMVDGIEHTVMDESGALIKVAIENGFWWAEGNAALHQNWVTGDFDAWIDDEHFQAFGVWFLRADIEKLIPAVVEPPSPLSPAPAPAAGERPPADWWDDLWVEICRQLMLAISSRQSRAILKPRCCSG